MKKYFFVFIFFVLGPAVALAQQADLRKDDQRFFKGQPAPLLGDPTAKTQQQKLPTVPNVFRIVASLFYMLVAFFIVSYILIRMLKTLLLYYYFIQKLF